MRPMFIRSLADDERKELSRLVRRSGDAKVMRRAQMIRMSADADGLMAQPALWVFRLIDSIMACTQLRRLKERVETHRARSSDPEHPETGSRDQFQYYEAIYASGERAGVQGKEDAYIFLSDRWSKYDLKESRYVWLPIQFDDDGTLRIEWKDEWDLSVFE